MIIAAIQTILAGLAAGFSLMIGRAWAADKPRRMPGWRAIGLGAVTNFFDTLGIGSFAPTTAALKAGKMVADSQLPGTLNAGHCLPTIAQALIFIALVTVDVVLLVSCIGAAVAGAWVGARIVSRLPVQAIQLVMGLALLIAAALFSAANLNLMPGGGTAVALSGAAFGVAVAVHLLLGGLMAAGIGLYAPSLILLSLLGLDPKAAFPIMMGACAFLMPVAASAYLRTPERLSVPVAAGLAIGGVPAVLVAAYLVKEMPLDLLRWLVVVVVLIAAVGMLRSALKSRYGN